MCEARVALDAVSARVRAAIFYAEFADVYVGWACIDELSSHLSAARELSRRLGDAFGVRALTEVELIMIIRTDQDYSKDALHCSDLQGTQSDLLLAPLAFAWASIQGSTQAL